MSNIKKKNSWKLTLLILLAELVDNQMLDILNLVVSLQILLWQLTEEAEMKSQIGLI